MSHLPSLICRRLFARFVLRQWSPIPVDLLTFFFRFFFQLLAAMTTDTPHVRSAAVICIARVVYQHSDLPAVNALATEVLPAVLLLFQDSSREVVKSAIMFLRVALACLEADTLKSLLGTVR
jgi:hypothetical protein